MARTYNNITTDRASAAPPPTPARALSEKERDKVFDTLCSERFVDRSPAEVVATLLDEDVYLCSERTMYRVLASQVPVRSLSTPVRHSWELIREQSPVS